MAVKSDAVKRGGGRCLACRWQDTPSSFGNRVKPQPSLVALTHAMGSRPSLGSPEGALGTLDLLLDMSKPGQGEKQSSRAGVCMVEWWEESWNISHH